MGAEGSRERELRPITIIWVAMLAALPLYLLAGLLAAPTLMPALGAATLGVLRKALYAAAAAILLSVGRVRRLVRGERGPADGPERISASFLPRYATAVIVSLVMCESIAIFGLLLYFLGRNAIDLFLLLGVSAAAMVYYRPQAEEIASRDL